MAAPSVNGTIGTSSTNPGSVTTITWSHTVAASLTNSLLLVTAVSDGSPSGATCTWNGTSMTAGTVFAPAYGPAATLYCTYFYLAAPAAGTFNLVMSWTTAARMYAAGYTLTSAAQSSPIDSEQSSGNANTTTTFSDTFTTLSDNTLVIDWCNTNLNQSVTIGSGQTQGWNITDSTAGEQSNSSYKVQATAGSVTMSDTVASASRFAGTAIAVKGIAGRVSLPFKSLLGVGI